MASRRLAIAFFSHDVVLGFGVWKSFIAASP
jgi:hypothetical protein